MSTPFSYSHTFVLDRPHFNECFKNSVEIDNSVVAYKKALVFSLIGVALLLATEVSGYIAYFLIGLGVVEALSVFYRQPWWVARQMLSRAANSKVNLTIDESGIHIDSFYVKSTIAWSQIDKVQQTQDGLLIFHQNTKSYLSGNCLSPQAREYLLNQAVKPE